MPLPQNRKQSVKRVYRRTQTGKVAIHYKKATPAWIKCRLCGVILGGVNNCRSVAKSKKVPSRMFGGQLCSACVSEIIKARARIKVGTAKVTDYPVPIQEFVLMGAKK